VRIRAAGSDDRPAALALLEQEVQLRPYMELPSYYLDLALSSPSEEARMLAAEVGGQLVGLVVLGLVAGSVGAGRVFVLVVHNDHRHRALGRALLSEAVTELEGMGARFVIAEIPDDPPLGLVRFFESASFEIIGRLANYYRDGVDQVIVSRDCHPD
jgi:ribosomal protein S18 acetylase RimI-like enzyme